MNKKNPFGMGMPGRTYNAGNYRYGFNGKENDNEVKGEGNQQDYGMRIYDPRVGRFLSVDPLAKNYPELTPYQFASNIPIKAIDVDGLETSWRPPGQLAPRENEYGSRSESTCQTCHIRKSIPKRITPNVTSRIETIGPDKSTYYSRQQSEIRKSQLEKNKAIQRATMDPFAASVAAGTLVAAQQYVTGIADHAVGVYEGVKEGNYWGATGNALLLTIDASPLLFKGGSTVSTAAKTGGSRFIVTEGGTAIIEDANLLTKSLDNAGFSKFSTQGAGVGYNLPNGVQARIMQPTGANPLRVSFGNGATRTTAEGLVPQKPFGMSPAQWKIRLNQLTHVNLK